MVPGSILGGRTFTEVGRQLLDDWVAGLSRSFAIERLRIIIKEKSRGGRRARRTLGGCYTSAGEPSDRASGRPVSPVPGAAKDAIYRHACMPASLA